VWGWPWLADAQRFVSLYSGKGPEEIFTYWDPSSKLRALEAVRIPTLVLLAERDEFASLSAQQLAEWFNTHIKNGEVVIVPRVTHGFRGAETRITKTVREWIRKQI